MGFRPSRLHPGWSRFHQSIKFPSTCPTAKKYRHTIQWSTNIIPHTRFPRQRKEQCQRIRRVETPETIQSHRTKQSLGLVGAGPGFTRPQPPEVLVVAYDPTLKRVE
ncbi:hypothetical protein PSTT_06112 [Puccinia striiformis]|uniref:Uncharacterized protein n=1 Tax=Puccinia striiformis TaxID=27350 RepID=A0A2S4VLR0_9BASI|nr:hypothetical protein PSTT_06112 [Puccinia striiformis]